MDFRKNILKEFTTDSSVIKEVLDYNNRFFDYSLLEGDISIPLSDESHIGVWKEYREETKYREASAVLKNVFVQFSFPIEKGIAEEPYYKDVTLRGKDPADIPQAKGLQLKSPGGIDIQLQQTIAGKIPVLIVSDREDFISILRALLYKNEPVELSASMGAMMVSGYNNWDRIKRYKEKWLQENPDKDWGQGFKELIPQKELYQDKFMILSVKEYSAVRAEELKLSKEEWLKYSLQIRIGHESLHYFTKRALGSMKSHLLDELIADYQGICRALGYYKAEWFLQFMGLEDPSSYREGGRMENYVDRFHPGESAFKVLQKLLRLAAHNLEEFDRLELKEEDEYLKGLTLTYFTLEELAFRDAVELLKSKYTDLKDKIVTDKSSS